MGWNKYPLAAIVAVVLCLPSYPALASEPYLTGEITTIPPSNEVAPIAGAELGAILASSQRFFIENNGQLGREGGLLFYRGDPLSVCFAESRVSYIIREQSGKGVRIDLSFPGSNKVDPVGHDLLGSTTNYLIGDDPNRWSTENHGYAEVLYHGLYNGIDLRYYFSGASIKYDFIVGPYADVSAIRLSFDGTRGVSIDEAVGDLLLETDIGILRDMKPSTYQIVDMARKEIDCRYVNFADGCFGIALGPHEDGIGLIVDPEIVYCTFLGGTVDDNAWAGFVFDENGDVYLAGETSNNFPTTPGAFDTTAGQGSDGYVTKINMTSSTLAYSTFIGGNGDDCCFDICLGRDGGLYVVGNAGSTDFPTTPGAYCQTNEGSGFVLELSSDGGHLVFSTRIGPAGMTEIEQRSNGSIVCVGNTYSQDYPVSPNAYDKTSNGDLDIVVIGMDEHGTKLEFATYLGGKVQENCRKMRLDPDENILIGGETNSSDFPTTIGAFCSTYKDYYDAFLVRFNDDGSVLNYSTFVGGSGFETFYSFVLHDQGTAIGCGLTSSTNLPVSEDAFQTTRAGNQDGFLFSLDIDTSKMNFLTYLGGTDMDRCEDLYVNSSGSVIVAGFTRSPEFPVTDDAMDDTLSGGADAFIVAFNPNGSQIAYGTFLGGSGGELYISIGEDGNNMTWVVLSTNSVDFPVTEGAYDTSLANSWDVSLTGFSLGEPTGNPPGPPLNLTATSGERCATLSWLPPERFDGPAVSGYRIYRGLSETSLTFLQRVKPDIYSGFTDHPLTNGVRYFYHVSAVNYFGEGPSSPVINVTPMGFPGRPRFLAVTVVNDTIRLNWSMPSDLGGGELLGYWVLRGNDPNRTLPIAALGNATEYVDVNVSRCIHYFYRVLAFTIKGNGSLSEAVTAFICDVPSAPYVFKPVPGLGSITIYWTAPSNDGGHPVLGYMLYRGISDTSLEPIADFASAFIYMDEGLAARIKYYYCVAAFNELGEGPRSAMVNATPLSLPGMARDLAAMAGDGCVTLVWAPPDDDGGSPVLGYRIYRSLGGGIVDASIDVKVGTSYLDPNVVNGRTYFYSIAAYSELGEGIRSGSLSAMAFGRPKPAEGFKAEAMEDSIRLTWGATLDDGGSPITGYRIYRGFVAEDMDFLTDVGSDMLSYTDMGLEDGLKHYYSIAVLNKAGESAPTGQVSAIPYGRPSIIEGLEARVGDGKVILQWSPPAHDGGLPIVGYNVFRATDGSDLVLLVMTTETNYTDSAVTNGVTYFYAVTGLNRRLEGFRTAPVNATPVAPISKPGVPRGFAASLVGRDAHLNWTAPATDPLRPVLGYVVLRGETPTTVTTVVYTGAGLGFTDVGLKPGRTYYYVVLANNTVGQGARSQVVSVSVPKEKKKEPGFEGALAVCALAAMLMALDRRRRR